LAENSLRPDSVYADLDFNLSFDITANGFSGPIDGTNLALRLLDENDSLVTTLFNGSVAHSDFSAGVIAYRSIAVQVNGAAVDTARYYRLAVEYQLISEGNFFSLSQQPIDSLYILPVRPVSFVSGTFLPTAVGAGQEAFFVFEIEVAGDQVLGVNSAGSSFQIAGDGFSTTTNLIADGDSLVPGPNQLESERVFIPDDQLGDSLMVTARLEYGHRGAGNFLSFSTDFEGLKIGVQELPLVQIEEVSIVALNSPRVNTDQAFQICCKIVNLSTSD
jgi:hypothetical protein